MEDEPFLPKRGCKSRPLTLVASDCARSRPTWAFQKERYFRVRPLSRDGGCRRVLGRKRSDDDVGPSGDHQTWRPDAIVRLGEFEQRPAIQVRVRETRKNLEGDRRPSGDV